MIINNAKLVSADDPIKQWVYITLTVDGDECRYVTVVPWNHVIPAKLEGQGLIDYCNGRESQYQLSILKSMYPGARYGNDLQDFLDWISSGHTNTAYCSIAEHSTQQDCLDAGGKWTPEQVITKVPFVDSHDYVGDQRTRKLESVRAGAKTQIEDVAGYPQWFQNNCANGLYPSATGDAMTAYIALVITESNRCEDLVTDAETLDEALAVTPDWPEV